MEKGEEMGRLLHAASILSQAVCHSSALLSPMPSRLTHLHFGRILTNVKRNAFLTGRGGRGGRETGLLSDE